jgi:LysR family hydrogen peroxide-inducible transcriptional activator
MAVPTLRQLEYAVALADHGHFGRAAEASFISQPGLSGQIRELEERLGVELFERGSKAVTLTEAGADVVARARLILRDVDELTAAADAHRDTIAGRLRLAAIPTMAPYLLPRVVRMIRRIWPSAVLDLQEQQTAELVHEMENGDLDLGLLAVPYDTGSLHVEPLEDESFHVALPRGHELESTEPLPLEALRELPMLLLPEGHCLRDHALTACELAGRVEHSEVHGASLSTLTQMVAGGVGTTLLPTSAIPVEAREGNGISVRPLEQPAPGRTVALVWRTTDPRGNLYSTLADRLRAA